MLKVPVQQGHPGGDLLHWDFDVRAERRRFKLFQATLFLEDCARDQGTFQCVRGFQTKYEEWRGQTSDAELDEIMSSNRVPCAPEFEPTVVAGKAGDLLIWDVRLLSYPCNLPSLLVHFVLTLTGLTWIRCAQTFMPHGHTFNTSDRVRLNQFLTMYPCEDEAIYRDALRVMWPNSAPSHDGSDLGDVVSSASTLLPTTCLYLLRLPSPLPPVGSLSLCNAVDPRLTVFRLPVWRA